MRIVVDASITGMILLSDEMSEQSAEMQENLIGSELLLAAHWPLEVASLLIKAMRRQRLSKTDLEKRLAEVDGLTAVGKLQPTAAARDIYGLALAANLTAYDAVYLELAVRLDATLASNDDALIAAARTRGVPVVTTRP